MAATSSAFGVRCGGRRRRAGAAAKTKEGAKARQPVHRQRAGVDGEATEDEFDGNDYLADFYVPYDVEY